MNKAKETLKIQLTPGNRKKSKNNQVKKGNEFVRIPIRFYSEWPRFMTACDTAVRDVMLAETYGNHYSPSVVISFKEISDRTSYCPRAVKASVKKLAKEGIIVKDKTEGQGGRNRYYINAFWGTENSLLKKISGISEKPTDKRQKDEPDREG